MPYSSVEQKIPVFIQVLLSRITTLKGKDKAKTSFSEQTLDPIRMAGYIFVKGFVPHIAMSAVIIEHPDRIDLARETACHMGADR